MTYPQQQKRNHGVWLVVAAAVLGVFVFCGIVVAAAGNTGNKEQPAETTDVAKNGALAIPKSGPAPTTAAQTAAAQTTAAPTAVAEQSTQAGATTQAAAPTTPATRKPATTTKPPAPRPTTKPPANNCHPSYTPCVPVASDVDCAGGSGDGPAYVDGPITVIGTDVYKLDHDKDGIGCE